MKLKRNEDQSVDSLPLLRIRNKTPMEGVTEHRSACSQSAIGWITGLPTEELEKVPKELKGSATL